MARDSTWSDPPRTASRNYAFDDAVTPDVACVDAYAAWDLESSSTEPAAVTFTGNIAAQRALRKTGGNARWTAKAAFDLLNSGGRGDGPHSPGYTAPSHHSGPSASCESTV
jgi:hypothetical protein